MIEFLRADGVDDMYMLKAVLSLMPPDNFTGNQAIRRSGDQHADG